MIEQDRSRPDGDGGEPMADSLPDVGAGRSDGVVVARLAEIEARFGEALDDAQRAQIRRAIERQMTLAARLRRTPLANGDEPEIVFRPYRGTDQGKAEASDG